MRSTDQIPREWKLSGDRRLLTGIRPDPTMIVQSPRYCLTVLVRYGHRPKRGVLVVFGGESNDSRTPVTPGHEGGQRDAC